MTPRERVALAALEQASVALAEAAALLRSEDAAPAGDRLLSAREASKRTGMSTRWLYKHAPELPFAVRTSERAVRFSEQGIERWVLRRQDL